MPPAHRVDDAVRRPRPAPAVVLAVVGVGLVVSLAAAGFGGALLPPPDGLNDAGPLVRWSLPLLRVVHDIAAALTVGVLVVATFLLPSGDGHRRATGPGGPDVLDVPDVPVHPVPDRRLAEGLRIATASGFVWALAGLVGVVFRFADAAGLPFTHPAFGAELANSVWAIEALRVEVISVAAAFVVTTTASFALSRWAALWATVIAVFGVVVLALGGHAGGSENHETAVNAMGVHLLTASLWVGGLLAIIVLRPVLGATLWAVVRRYSTLALWCFLALGVSGVITATTRLGWADLGAPYGLLVLGKVAAFVALGFAGWWHRRSTVAALAAQPASPRGRSSGPQVRLADRPFLRLAVGEVVVMGLALGLATALARTAPPVPESSSDPSRVLALTGFPAPPAPDGFAWLGQWRVDWLFLSVGLLAIVAYLAGVLRLRRRGDAWPVGRTLCWVAGWVVFLVATCGPLGVYGRVSFSWHMALHMVEAMVAPIMLVLGAPLTLALRAVRPRNDGTIGVREILLRIVHSRALAVVGNPVFAAAFFFTSLVAFYWSGLFELALTSHVGHLLMTAHFMLTGYLFAWVLVGVDPGPRRWSPALRLIVLFATIAFHAFFGVAMIGGTSVLAPDFFQTLDLPWVPDPLQDQRNGGGIAWAIGEVPSLVLALIVAAQWFGSDRAESRRRDRKADRDGDAELAAYNAQLAQLADRNPGRRD